jgi:cation:H+ antiporter
LTVDVVLLVLAFVVILAGAELFTNGIEWFGHKLELAEGAVGSVLAAVGTALPETMIPLIAIAFTAGDASSEIGIGAILGAPFMLATLAMFVTGVAVLAAAGRREGGDVMLVDASVLIHDMRFFALAYAVAIAVAFLPADLVWPRWAVAAFLIGTYAYYVREHLRAEAGSGMPDLAPLRLHRLDRGAPAHPAHPRLRIVTVQVVGALVFIVVGAYVFVGAIEHLATSLGIAEVILALVLAPIATELPEKFNSVIWVRARKDTLAMGNITGAMVFQSAIPTVIALVLATDHWVITPDSFIAFASAGIAFLSAGAIFIPMARSGRLRGRGLLIGGVFYLGYLALVISGVGRGPV